MALKRKVVAVDSGAFNTKGKSDIGEVIFNTKYSKGHTDIGLVGEDTYNVTINGVELTIGNSANRTDKREGKHTEVHIWSALTSVALLRGGAKEIILMYGESFNKYVQPEQKLDIARQLEGKHVVEIETKNGKEEHVFEITLVHILPEGLGHILSNLRAYQGMQYVLDWGGSTINFLEVENGRPNLETSKSFQLGMHNLTAIVMDKISKAGIGNYSENQVKQWIQQGCSNRDIQSVIDDAIDDQLYKIDDKLSGFGINLHEYLTVTFIGGTTQLFERQIKQYYNCASIYGKCLTANVDGFYEFGRLKYGNQAK